MAQLVCRQIFGLKKHYTIIPTGLLRTSIKTFATEADPEDYGYCKFRFDL